MKPSTFLPALPVWITMLAVPAAAQTIPDPLTGTVILDVSGGPITFPNASTIAEGGTSISYTHDGNGTRQATLTGILSGTGSLTFDDPGILLLSGANTYSGATIINQGTVLLGTNTALGATSAGTTIHGAGTLNLGGRSLQDEVITLNGGIITNTGADQNNALRYVTVTANSTFGGTGRWDIRGAGATVTPRGSLALDGHIVTKNGTNKIAIVDSSVTGGGIIDIGAGILGITRSGGAASFGGVTIKVGALGTVQFENNSNADYNTYQSNIELASGILQNAGNPTIVTGAIATAGASTFNIASTFTAAGVLSGADTLTKTGAGSLVLANSDNTFSGAITISAGTLEVQGSIASSSGITNNATLLFNSAGAQAYSNAITGTGALTKQGGGVLTLSGANTYAGTTTISGGTLLIAGADNRLATAAAVSLGNTAGVTLDLNGLNQEIRSLAGGGTTGGMVTNSGAGTSVLTIRPTGGDNATFSGVIDGDIRLAIVGGKAAPSFAAPRQRLAGTSNTFTGGLVIDGATLLARQDGSLGAVPAVFDPANLTLQNNGTLLNEATANPLSIHANRGITLGAGGGALVGGFSGTPMENPLTVQSVISGAAGNNLTIISNNGTVVFTGNNTYAGDTIIEGTTASGIGRLQIGSGGTSGTLGNGNVTNNGQLTINRSDAYTYGGDISGTGALIQAGGGTTTLTGTNTYTGATTISAGTLALAAGGSLGNTSVSVGTAGTLAGSGAIAGNVTLAGILAPGNSTGTLNFAGNLGLADGSALVFDHTGGGTAADLVQVGATLDLTGTIGLTLIDLGTYTLGDRFTLFSYESLTGSGLLGGHADGGVFAANGGDWRIDYADTTPGLNGGTISGAPGSGFITITAIPEPGTLGLGAIGLLALLRRRRA